MMNIGDRLLAKPEFEYYWGISDEDKKYMDELAQFVSKYGVNLLTIPIPYQSALYIDASNNPSPKTYDPAQANKFYELQVKNLELHRMNPINLNQLIGTFPKTGDFFAKRDHHWTGPAMEFVAQEVARRVNQLKLPLTQTSTTTLNRSVRDYAGSLADELKDKCGFVFPSTEQRTFYELSINSNEGLLDDANSDIVLVGDSFGISYFGFDKVLSDALKAPITNYSINGGGCCSSINGFFASLAPETTKPKLIIWTSLMVLTNANEVRELKPSIYQAYENNTPIKSFQNEALMGTMNIKLDKNKRYYVKLNTVGPKTENLSFKINYKDNSEKVNLYRKDESQKTSYDVNYFYELKPGSDLLSGISFDTFPNSKLTVSVYQYK